MNKPVYLELSKLEISKLLMYEFWYDYVKRKYAEKAKLCYMDTHSLIVYIKADDIYKDIAEDAECRSDTSNYELNKPFPKGKNKKVIGLITDELAGKIMVKFVGLRAKVYSYLVDDGSEDKKAKRKLKFENYKSCLEATQLENELNHPEKNKIDIDSFFC